MKKFAFLLLLTMLFPITFGCAKNKAEPDYSIVTYYGSVQKTEENSGLYSLYSGQYSIWLTDKGTGAGITVMGVQNIFIGIPKAERITESNLEVIFYDFWWM